MVNYSDSQIRNISYISNTLVNNCQHYWKRVIVYNTPTLFAFNFHSKFLVLCTRKYSNVLFPLLTSHIYDLLFWRYWQYDTFYIFDIYLFQAWLGFYCFLRLLIYLIYYTNIGWHIGFFLTDLTFISILYSLSIWFFSLLWEKVCMYRSVVAKVESY